MGFALLMPLVIIAGELNTTVHYTQCQTQADDRCMFGDRDGWLFYDNGSPHFASAWDSAGDGAGVRYVAPYPCRVETCKAYMGLPNWPSPGGNKANFALYSGTTQPTNRVWYARKVSITRGAWNSIRNDTIGGRLWNTGENIYPFYFQDTLNPYCPSFSADNYCNYAAYSWVYWNLGGGFLNENPGGDWMIRLFVTSSPGVGEWLSHTPIEPELKIKTISSGSAEVSFTLAEPGHIRLLIFDVIGRQCATVVSQYYAAGTHAVRCQFDLVTGAYLLNLKTDNGFNITKKFVIIK